MKYSVNVVRDAFERSTLKLAVLVLSILSLTFGVLLTLDLTKEPILIERACETKVMSVVSSSQTKEEVEIFVREAIALRFDSLAARDPSSFLVQDLFAARLKEQEELKRSGIDQRMIIRKVKLDGDRCLIDVDRLIAIGNVRSAIPIVLAAKISSKARSLTNPYGLVLTQIEQMKEEKKDD